MPLNLLVLLSVPLIWLAMPAVDAVQQHRLFRAEGLATSRGPSSPWRRCRTDQNAKKLSDKQNACIDHDTALLRVPNDTPADRPEFTSRSTATTKASPSGKCLVARPAVGIRVISIAGGMMLL